MTVTERLGPVARSVIVAQVARKLRRDVPAMGKEAADTVEHVLEVVAKVADDLAKTVERASEQAKEETLTVSREIGDVATGTVDTVADAASRATRELKLEQRVDDVVQRLRKELPTERITSLVTSLERELPTTDKDRYDRAYRRGWSRARTSFVGVGLVAGVAAGVVGALLLDPKRGPQRRAALKSRATEIGTTVSREARGKAAWTVERARGIAAERGLLKPAAGIEVAAVDDAAQPSLVPVMDPGPDDGARMAESATERLETTSEDIAQMVDEGSPISTNPA